VVDRADRCAKYLGACFVAEGVYGAAAYGQTPQGAPPLAAGGRSAEPCRRSGGAPGRRECAVRIRPAGPANNRSSHSSATLSERYPIWRSGAVVSDREDVADDLCSEHFASEMNVNAVRLIGDNADDGALVYARSRAGVREMGCCDALFERLAPGGAGPTDSLIPVAVEEANVVVAGHSPYVSDSNRQLLSQRPVHAVDGCTNHAPKLQWQDLGSSSKQGKPRSLPRLQVSNYGNRSRVRAMRTYVGA
jgi:hypothetical protein